jgi:FkbM family methyltransferase
LYYGIYRWSRPRQLTTVELAGFRLLVDPADRGVASFLLTVGTYEPLAVSVFSLLAAEGDCVVDVGAHIAHIGYYTVIAAKTVGPQGRVIAIEPNPNNFSLLQRNIALNEFDARATAVPCAVSAEAGRSRLYLSDVNHGDHRLDMIEGGSRRSIEVPVERLDDVVPPGARVAVVKMDIQGAELGALKGMQRVLAENPDLALLTEFWPNGMRGLGHEPVQLLDALQAYEFALFQIDESAQRLVQVSDRELRKYCSFQHQLNLLAVRGQSRARVERHMCK